MKRYFLPIIVSAVSLVVISVVSYAYFTITLDTSGITTSNLRTATIGTVTFVTTSPSSNTTNVYPGWEGEGSTTVYFNANSGDDVAYHCTVSLESGSYANNVYVQTLTGNDAQVPAETALTEQGVTVSQGILEAQNNITAPGHGTEHVVTYKIIFKETGEAQNADQGKTINTYATCVVDQMSGTALTTIAGTLNDENGDPLANQAFAVFSTPTYFETDAAGHYEVRLAKGMHDLYYVPDMSLADLQAAGESIKTNANAKTRKINVTKVETNKTISYATPYIVSVTCTNCTTDYAEKDVALNATATFNITADTGYTLSGATVTGGCTLSNGVLTLANVSANTLCSVTVADNRLVSKIQSDNTVSTRSSFDDVFVDNTTGTIYSTDRTDDESTVYYYSGNTTNNWVIFGNNGSGTYYYWRIIRTNSDEEGGGVRLLYSGSGTSSTTIPSDLTNAIVVSDQAFNSSYDNASYVGYMYTAGTQHGNGTSSDIKNQVESWYTSSGLSNFESKINTKAVYCNDRSMESGTTWDATGSNQMNYATRQRLYAATNDYPTYKCGGDTTGSYYDSSVSNRLADKFSKEATPGNGLLSKPIALITADEIAFAGGKYGTSLSSPYAWYYTNGSGSSITGSIYWWTMSPYYWDGSDAYVMYVYGTGMSGRLVSYFVYGERGVRPVVSLVSSALVSSGNGTPEAPYIIAD